MLWPNLARVLCRRRAAGLLCSPDGVFRALNHACVTLETISSLEHINCRFGQGKTHNLKTGATSGKRAIQFCISTHPLQQLGATGMKSDRRQQRGTTVRSGHVSMLDVAHKHTSTKEILLWKIPSEPPTALQASECSELRDPMRASCQIPAQH